MFKFLHAADIHLDSPLRGLAQYPGAPVEQIRQATRRALENLVDLAIREKVAFVLIAGDLYDGDRDDYNSVLFFNQQMKRLDVEGIGVFVIRGNHDAANRMTTRLNPPSNVTVFPDDEPLSAPLDELKVMIHGQGFATESVLTDLSRDYPPGAEEYFNIGLLHTCAGGVEGHDDYAPCKYDVLKSKRYQYWALGHVHQHGPASGLPQKVLAAQKPPGSGCNSMTRTMWPVRRSKPTLPVHCNRIDTLIPCSDQCPPKG